MPSKFIVAACTAFVLAVASMAYSAEPPAHPRPKALHCWAPDANDQAREFDIEKFDTNSPGATNDAADSDGPEVNDTVTTLCVNNGCDNSYCMVFFTDDVTALTQGKRTVIHALMNYLNSSSVEGQELADTVSLYCSVKM